MSNAFCARRLAAVGAAFLVVIGFLESEVSAAPIAIGGAILTPAEPDPAFGSVIGSIVNAPFASPVGPGQFTGTLSTTVIRNDPTNPFAGIGDPNPANHGLTFVYQLHNDASSLTS